MSKSKNKGRRGITQTTANHRLPTSSPTRQWDLSDYLLSIEDRRTSHPDGPVRAPRSTRAFHVNYQLAAPRQNKSNPWDVPSGIQFEDPSRVLICIRRKQRKEVLHALKKTGKSGQKRPRRNHYSEVLC